MASNAEGSWQLRPTAYERVSIGLTSVLLMLGAITLLMLVVWLSRAPFAARHPATVSLAVDPAAQDAEFAASAGGQFSAPEVAELGADEFVDESALESIAQIVESHDFSLEALANGQGIDGRRSGTKGQIGDESGPDSISGNPFDRWEIRFSATDLEEYKRQLDHFGIELGVAGGGISTVDYVKDFTAVVPTTRMAQDPKREKRVRFLYRDGPLKEADRQLARAAGISVEGRVVFQFHTSEMYNKLLELEFEPLKPRGIRIKDVVRTVFEVRKTESGYEFYVVRQDYRAGASAPQRIPST